MIKRIKRLSKMLRQQKSGSLKRLIKLTNLWQYSLKKKEKGFIQNQKLKRSYHRPHKKYKGSHKDTMKDHVTPNSIA